MSRSVKTIAWVIVLTAAAAALIYFASRPLSPSSDVTTRKTSGGGGGNRTTWNAVTTQYIVDQHAKAEQAMKHADFTQARVILLPLLGKYPNDAVGHILMAKAMMGQGKWRSAYREATKSCRIDDRQPEAHMLAGVLAERFGDLAAARRHYERASELEPASLQSTLYLANICLKLKDWTSADLYALRVLRLDPSKAIAYAITAQTAASQGQTRRAVEQWQKALIHTKPGSPQYLPYTLQYVMLLRRKGAAGRKEALNVLLSLPQGLRDGRREVTEELAQTYLSLSQPADASNAWLHWLKDHPMDGAAAAEAGLDAQRAGLTDRARQYLSIAKKLAPKYPLTEALEQAVSDKPATHPPQP